MKQCQAYIGEKKCCKEATHIMNYTDSKYKERQLLLCKDCATERLNTKRYPWGIAALS